MQFWYTNVGSTGNLISATVFVNKHVCPEACQENDMLLLFHRVYNHVPYPSELIALWYNVYESNTILQHFIIFIIPLVKYWANVPAEHHRGGPVWHDIRGHQEDPADVQHLAG